MSNSENILRTVLRPVARLCLWIMGPSIEIEQGCPNCALTSVNDEEYDICPWCGWGPEREPVRTMDEAHSVFLNRVMQEGRKKPFWERWRDE